MQADRAVRELSPPDTALAFEAMRALRPALADAESFATQVDECQRPEGYRLVAAFDGDWKHAAAVAGFRVATSLSWGRFLYVDDLSTFPPARRRGHARALLEWVLEETRRLGCDQLHLDSGVGPERAAAHHLYFASGFQITAHHFARLP
jgi:GNAT superfamily N-acetyltransferase